jgi:predicted nucleotidyltransferase
MIIKDQISKDRNRFILLGRNHSVRYLYAFGSSVTGNFDENASDIDLLVEIDADPLTAAKNCLNFGINLKHFSGGRLISYRFIDPIILKKRIDLTRFCL